MSRLIVVGTGSKGNTYLLQCGEEILVIDCGMRFMEVKKALKFNIRGIVGAIVTHVHGDHHAYAHEYEKAGIEVWKPYEEPPYIRAKQMGSFTVRSFDCVHNVPCVGYLISNRKDNLKMLYATDTEYVRYSFSGLTVALLEANYGEEYVNREEPKYRHVLQGHQSIETALQCIRANMNPELAHICLCHLSAGNSDEKAFKTMVQELVPPWVDVTVAEPGLIVDLKEIPF